jgi:cell division protein FtsB
MGSLRKTSALGLWLGVVIVYLIAQALTGRQGLFAYVELQGRERALEAQLAELGREHAALEARARRLRAATFDADYLHETARLNLGANATNELVFALSY